jgi:hypothetical protein
MKYTFLTFLTAATVLFSCSSEQKENTNASANKETSSKSTALNIELPDDPCELISQAMVLKHFDVLADSLEKDEYNREGSHWTEKCAYKWNKADFEAINSRNLEKMMASMKEGSIKSAVKTGKSMEKPQKHIGVTNLRQFDSQEEAHKYFKNSHTKPSKEDMAKLDKEFEKHSEKQGLTEQQEETGKALSGGIAGNLKFIDVDGIGDVASWDDLGSKLDILIGTVQFGVSVHTGEGTETDIQKAKEVAKDIIANF